MKDLLENIRTALEGRDAHFVVRYLGELGLKVAFSSSLGQEDQVITHLIAGNRSPIRVFTLDTGRLFPETYELLDKTSNKYNINIEVVFPNETDIAALVAKQGVNGFYNSVDNRKNCCSVRKIIPLRKALQDTQVWVTGLRASQSDNRSQLQMVEWDEAFGVIKVNPLINWSYDEVIEYLNQYNVPYNPLHDKGFVSIGCQPCTRAISEGEDLRAGRWWWESSKKECGLHQH